MKLCILLAAFAMALLNYFSYQVGYNQGKNDTLVLEYRSSNVEELLENDLKVCKLTHNKCVLDSFITGEQVGYKVIPKPTQLPL